MHKEHSSNNFSKGLSVVEVIIALSILSVAFTGVVTSAINSNNAEMKAGLNSRALIKAEEGLEVMRNIRDGSFANLTNGAWGVSRASGRWTTIVGSDTDGTFTRVVTVSSLNTNVKNILVTVSYGGKNPGSVSLQSYLGNLNLPQSSSLVINTSGGNIGGSGSRELRGLILQNIGGSTITIDKVSLTWTNSLSSINQVVLNGATVWSGTQASGSLIELTNTSIPAGTNIPVTRFRFSTNMSSPANSFVITFTLSDGSTKTATFP